MHTIARTTLTLMAANLAACASASVGSAGDSAPTPASASAARGQESFEWHTYAGEGGTRRYKLFVPAGLDPSGAAPLVVLLHGCTQDPDDLARGTRFNQAAAERGVIVAYPEQTAAQHPQKCWTWYDPAHQGRGAGEPAVVAGITREVMSRHRVDPERVYVAGVSAGGTMAVNVAAAYPDLYAAAAAHSAIAYRAAGNVMQGLAAMRSGASDPAALRASASEALRAGGRLPALFVVHGETDAVVSPANGRQLAEQWAGALGLGGPGTDVDPMNGRSVTFTWWTGSGGSRPVALMSVAGLGHAWSGGSSEGTFADPAGPSATNEILRFLLRQRLEK